MGSHFTQDGIPWVKPIEIDDRIDLRTLGLQEETLRLAEEKREEIGRILTYYALFMSIQLARFISENNGIKVSESDCEMAVLHKFVKDTRQKLTLTFRVTMGPWYQEYWDATLTKKPDGTIDTTVPLELKDFSAAFAKAEARRKSKSALGGHTPVLS